MNPKIFLRNVIILGLICLLLSGGAHTQNLLVKKDSAKFTAFSSPDKSTALMHGNELFVSIAKCDPFTHGSAYPALLKFNQNTLTLVDSVVYPQSYPAFQQGCQMVESGNYLYFVYRAMVNGQVDVGVIKTDLTGTILQAKKYGYPTDQEYTYGITATKDSGVAIVGNRVNSSGSTGFFLKVKSNMKGTFNYYSDFPQGIVQLSSGSFIITMNRLGPGFDFATNYVIKARATNTTTGTIGDSLAVVGYAPPYDRFNEAICMNGAGNAFVAGFANYNTDKVGVIKGNATSILKVDSVDAVGRISQIIPKIAGGYEFVGYGTGTLLGPIKSTGDIADNTIQNFPITSTVAYSCVQTDSGFIVISKETIYDPLTFNYTYNLIIDKYIYQNLAMRQAFSEEIAENTVNIYPNPARDQIFVDQKFRNIEVFDLLGKLVKSYANTAGPIYLHLKTGVYLVKLSNESEAETKKLLIR